MAACQKSACFATAVIKSLARQLRKTRVFLGFLFGPAIATLSGQSVFFQNRRN